MDIILKKIKIRGKFVHTKQQFLYQHICKVGVKYFNIPGDDQYFDSNDGCSKSTPDIYFYSFEVCDKTDGHDSQKFYFFKFLYFLWVLI